MGFHFRFGAEDLLRCRFAVSPRWETEEAVRTLLRPARHVYHRPWLRRIRAAAEGLDLRPLWLLMPRTGHHPDFLSPPPDGPCVTVEEELARVRAAAAFPDAVREDLRRALVCTPGAAQSALGERMLADPARAVGELADLYEQAWQALVAPHWPRLRALLEADVLFHSRRLAAGGLEALFDGLHPDLRWHGSTLTIRRPGHHDRSLDGQGLLLMPSAFVWPQVVGGYDPPWQPTLVYPARGIGALWTASGGPAPAALARLLGRARAEVLCALQEPASTTALAHRLGLAPATVSAHLKALHGAGLLVSARHGHQVLYERTPLGIALTTGTAPSP